MTIDADTIARIDATLLPQLDRHHLRLLAHCLASFREMSADVDGALPDAAVRRQWCEQQPVVADDPQFLDLLLDQLNNAAHQLEELADSCSKAPLKLSLDDLIAAAERRCRS
jgi:hypothetical protein